MRLFVAVTPPPVVLEEVEQAVAPYRERNPDLRWVRQDRQHITLAFLGDVDEERLERLRPQLEDAASRHRPLELSFAGAGAFPRASRARVLWTGVAGDSEELAALAASVSAAARHCRIDQEKRKFSAHLTLARCRGTGDLRTLVDALSPFAGRAWTADEIHLVRSHLGPKPYYETLASWPLSGSHLGEEGP